MKLANVRELREGVNEVFLEGEKYFICKIGSEIKVYSSVCPHQGGRLFCRDSVGNSTEIYCKVHNWRFEAKSGKSSNIKSARLREVGFKCDENGNIYLDSANLQNLAENKAKIAESSINSPNSTHSAPPQFKFLEDSQNLANSQNSCHSEQSEEPQKNNIDLKITLHSHACLEFHHNDFSLLCDPWIIGSAFFGAWRHYPTPIIDEKNIAHLAKRTNAIWISHEHSDHFHPPTLEFFDRNIPIFVPAFPNARIEARLMEMGFKNIITAPFGERVQIAKDIFITTYEPASLWNDAQILLEVDGFRILNVNDAGINHKIHKIIQNVDCIASAFSPGASGYPATWTHLSDNEKIQIYENSRTATLEMLKEACEKYSARYFLPFASYFILNHPSHLKYMKILRKNLPSDVKSAFKDSKTKVIDLLSGDSWSVADNKIARVKRENNIFDFGKVEAHIKNDFNKLEFEARYPKKCAFDREKVFEYFKNLNAVPEIIFCEDLVMNIFPSGNKAFAIEVKNGVLQVKEKIAESANITMKIPSEILMHICKYNESWDEVTIGYWCEFSRNPNVYHTEFWRILQCPYFLKNPRENVGKNTGKSLNTQSNVAEILERGGEMAQKILARYGLYCLSCNKAYSETLSQACAMHGLEHTQMERLLGELRRHLL